MGSAARPARMGFGDYAAMYRRRGIRLPLAYLRECHLFDLVNRTDTHRWLPKSYFSTGIENVDHGEFYMASWTSTVRHATLTALDMGGFELEDTSLLDVGSGKGKVLCVWENMFRRSEGLKGFGIEYNADLAGTCRDNLKKIGAAHTSIFEGDVTTMDLEFLSGRKNLLVYMFNPFDAYILTRFLLRLPATNVMLIYVHPVHASAVLDCGYEIVRETVAWHPGNTYTIFRNFR
jgi:hypothetical protein